MDGRAPTLLVVAGHDSSGGAGVDADREAAGRFGVRAACVVTAWTRQAGGRVLGVEARPESEWLAEARAALRSAPGALKSGLLPGAVHVRALAGLVGELGPGSPVVVDPVLAASGGEEFLDGEGRRALLEELVPCGVVLTPNLPELALLAGGEAEALAREPERRVRAARELLERGACAVVVKGGGHGLEDPVRDLVLEAGAPPAWVEHPRVAGGRLHGSGCRHASALAAQLCRGASLEEAAARAGRWLAERIRGGGGAQGG